jgi:hypothetical protein
VAIVAFSFLAKRITVAKLYYFDSDRHRLFYRSAGPSRSGCPLFTQRS